MLIKVKKASDPKPSEIVNEDFYFNRRKFLTGAAALGGTATFAMPDGMVGNASGAAASLGHALVGLAGGRADARDDVPRGELRSVRVQPVCLGLGGILSVAYLAPSPAGCFLVGVAGPCAARRPRRLSTGLALIGVSP